MQQYAMAHMLGMVSVNPTPGTPYLAMRAKTTPSEDSRRKTLIYWHLLNCAYNADQYDDIYGAR